MKIKVIQIYTDKQFTEQEEIDRTINDFLRKENPKEIIKTKIESTIIYAPDENRLNETAIYITIVYK